MTDYYDVKNAISEYGNNYNLSGIEDDLELVYFHSQSEWAELWDPGGVLRQYAEDPCVYFFFDDNEELLYVGQTKKLGKRFSQHNDRVTNPVAILPIPNEHWHHVLSIESYLINEFNPPDNKTGLR